MLTTSILLLLSEDSYLTRRYECDSVENFRLTPRAAALLLLSSRNNSSRKEDARTRNDVHLVYHKLPSEESHPVTDPFGGGGGDRTTDILGRTGEEHIKTPIKYKNNKRKMSAQ